MQRLAYIPLLVVAAVCSIWLLVKILSAPHCEQLIFYSPATTIADEKITVTDSTPGAKSWQWDFGDSTTISETQTATHRYAQPGKYLLSLTVNGSCRDVREITVAPKATTEIQIAHIQGPTEAVRPGQSVTFTEITPNATAWDWFFGESGKVDAHGRTVQHIFRSTGYKTVTVYVTTPTGKLTGTATVNVKMAPVEMPKPTISPKDFAGSSSPAAPSGPTGLAKKNKFIADFTKFMTTEDFNERVKLLDEFNKLVCNMGMEIKAKRKKKTLQSFCQEIIQDKDANEVKSLEVNFDDTQDCVSSLQVDYKSK